MINKQRSRGQQLEPDIPDNRWHTDLQFRPPTATPRSRCTGELEGCRAGYGGTNVFYTNITASGRSGTGELHHRVLLPTGAPAISGWKDRRASTSTPSVPEPASLALLGPGGLLGVVSRKTQAQNVLTPSSFPPAVIDRRRWPPARPRFFTGPSHRNAGADRGALFVRGRHGHRRGSRTGCRLVAFCRRYRGR